MTPATMIQAAWAMVLRRYTGSDDTSFGILSSGRDLPIDGINDIVGPLVTMLTSRVRLPRQQTVLEFLRAVQSDHMDSLAHQTFSLADVHTMLQLGTSSLFNTVLSIQRVGEAGDKATEIAFEYRDGADPTEVCHRKHNSCKEFEANATF
jgi:non-ribosomal peptide synthetase component F